MLSHHCFIGLEAFFPLLVPPGPLFMISYFHHPTYFLDPYKYRRNYVEAGKNWPKQPKSSSRTFSILSKLLLSKNFPKLSIHISNDGDRNQSCHILTAPFNQTKQVQNTKNNIYSGTSFYTHE